MKKVLKIFAITSIIMLVLLGGLVFFLYQNSTKEKKEEATLEKTELDMQVYGIKKESIEDDEIIPLRLSGEDKNVETFPYKETKEIYNPDYSKKVKKELTSLKKKNKYTVDNCLWAYNPYGTHALSLYVYFQTSEPVSLSYTIHVEDEDIPDFNRTAKMEAGIGLKEVEGVIAGLIPDQTNYIILKLKNMEGKVVKRIVYSITPEAAPKGVQKQLVVTDGKSLTSMSNGLYMFMGHDCDNKKVERAIYLYDNSGCLRGWIPIVNGRTVRTIWLDGTLLYNYSNTAFAKVAASGQVLETYKLKGYQLTNDFTFDGYGDIIAIASKAKGKTVEDQIVALNLKSGKTKHLLDMGSILKKVKKKAKDKKDWLGMNSVVWAGKDSVLVSAREVSGILKIQNVSSVVPKVEYAIGDDKLLKEEGYKKNILSKYIAEEKDTEEALTKEIFDSQFGQSTMAVSKLEEQYPISEAQYYLTMFNNNYNPYTEEKGNSSSFYKYYVDELTGTYDLVKSFELPYSTYESSVQEYAGNIIANSGTRCKVGEYDRDGGMIQEYSYNVETYTYRVFKESFKDFWFE